MTRETSEGKCASVCVCVCVHARTQKPCSDARETVPHTVCAFDVQAILLSPKFHCTEEMLTIVSLLSVDSVLCNPPSRRDEVQAVRRKFVSSEGDHVTLLNVYRAFRSAGGNKVSLASPPNPPPSRLGIGARDPSSLAGSPTEPRGRSRVPMRLRTGVARPPSCFC